MTVDRQLQHKETFFSILSIVFFAEKYLANIYCGDWGSTAGSCIQQKARRSSLPTQLQTAGRQSSEDELLDTVVHLVAEEVVETKAEQKEEVEKLIMNCFLSSLCVSKRLQVHYVNLRGEYMSVFC